MDFNLSDDQREMRSLAARILDDATDADTVPEPPQNGATYDKDLWSTLAEAGLLGMSISEQGGGMGFGLVELGLLLEEQGRTLAPVPLTATIAMAAMTIDRYGSAEERDAWLARIVSGDAIMTAAITECGNHDALAPMAKAESDGNRYKLSGTKVAVPYAPQAEAFIVTAEAEGGPALFIVEACTDGLTVETQVSTSGEPLGLVTLDDVELAGDAVVGSIETGGDVIADLVARSRVALAQRQVGIAGEALRRTAAYSSERIQFGKPLGSMQAVQQRAADAFIDVEAMRSSALLAAWQIDHDASSIADVAAAKYWAAMGGHRVVHTAQHLHGGTGADITYPIHRFFLHAIHISEELGGASPMAAEIGKAIAEGRTEALT